MKIYPLIVQKNSQDSNKIKRKISYLKKVDSFFLLLVLLKILEKLKGNVKKQLDTKRGAAWHFFHLSSPFIHPKTRLKLTKAALCVEDSSFLSHCLKKQTKKKKTKTKQNKKNLSELSGSTATVIYVLKVFFFFKVCFAQNIRFSLSLKSEKKTQKNNNKKHKCADMICYCMFLHNILRLSLNWY